MVYSKDKIMKRTNNNIKILHITRTDKYAAGSIVFDCFEAFKSKGYDTKLLSKYCKSFGDGSIISYYNSFQWLFIYLMERIKGKIIRIFKKVTKKETDPKYYFQSRDEIKDYIKGKKILKKINFIPDIIIFYFIDGFINAKTIYELYSLTNAKIYFYMMDSALLTGGCHYFWDCIGYQTGCNDCPAIRLDKRKSKKIFDFKEKYYNKMNINILVGTEWQYIRVKKSLIFKNKPTYKIFQPINSKLFFPTDKKQNKDFLKIPKSKKTIFFGSVSLSAERKGLKYLLDALEIIHDNYPNFNENIFLLIAGNNIDDIKDKLIFPYKYFGYINDNEYLSKIYQTADIFVCPSIEDAGPMMINQSIMCGTPVVAFDTGAAMDLVQNGKTGFKAEIKDSKSLANCIVKILEMSDNEYNNMSDYCRKFALENYSFDGFVKNFENIFFDSK